MITAAPVVQASAAGSLPIAGGATAAAALVVLGICLWRGWAPKLTIILAIIAGAGLSSGWIQHTATNIVNTMSARLGQLTSTAFGANIPWLLAVVMTVILLVNLWPHKNDLAGLKDDWFEGRVTNRKKPKRVSAVAVGFIYPLLVGTIPGQAGQAAQSTVHLIASPVASVIGGLFGTA